MESSYPIIGKAYLVLLLDHIYLWPLPSMKGIIGRELGYSSRGDALTDVQTVPYLLVLSLSRESVI